MPENLTDTSPHGVLSMLTPPNKPLLLVTWKDHKADGAWTDVEGFHGPSLCFQVGWLFKEDDEGITLAAGYSPPHSENDPHTTGNLQYILKSCITNRQPLGIKYDAPKDRDGKQANRCAGAIRASGQSQSAD